MRSKSFYISVLLGLALAGSGCGGDDGGGQASAAQGGRPGGPGGGRPQLPAVTVAVTPVIQGDIASRYTASGVLEAEKEAMILARVNGVIEDIPAEEGDFVKTGQVLLTIGDREFQYRLQQAQAELEATKAKFERGKKLVTDNLMSSEAFDDLKQAYESAKAATGLAELDLSYCRVEAPFSGRVTQRLVDPGVTVSNGTELFAIADFQPLLARVHVPSKMLGDLKADQPVELILDSSGERLTGSIKLISPVIDPQSGTIKLTVEVPSYPADTRAGDFVEVRIVTERHQNATLVPKSAVLEEKGEQYAFVAQDSTAVRRTLQTGFENEEHTEILSGLEPGEQIVIRGQRNLKDGQPLRIAEDVISQGGALKQSESE